MNVFNELFQFMRWLFLVDINACGYAFSLSSCVIGAAIVSLLLYIIHWLFKGDF